MEVRELHGISTGEQMCPQYTLATEPLTILFQHNLKCGKDRRRWSMYMRRILTDSGLWSRTALSYTADSPIY